MTSHTNQAHAQAQRGNRGSQSIRPLPENVIDHGYRYTIVQRVQCLTLIVEGLSGRDIEARIGVIPSTES